MPRRIGMLREGLRLRSGVRIFLGLQLWRVCNEHMYVERSGAGYNLGAEVAALVAAWGRGRMGWVQVSR